jgi:hypothetical protein
MSREMIGSGKLKPGLRTKQFIRDLSVLPAVSSLSKRRSALWLKVFGEAHPCGISAIKATILSGVTSVTGLETAFKKI